ncbi:Glutathione S-transferase [Labilithrix luteola]|uniref:Glutathione S-transferase n=1 Tax=Labilithrix luteola TaxID=1391654 RepID=A0A0K1Q761_9BACT|nr:glutathione S-transferase N-terminal domain-containing protein [Labilithrix luteola]AKV01671.1 Glutathione S-transferase [Labilithrix luteola]
MDTILFYTPGTCALAAIVTLEWLGQPYRLCRVQKAERQSEPFLRINPRGQVPAMLVDGRPLLESNAILAHLVDRRPELALLPRHGTWERDIANQWLAYLASAFHAAFWPMLMPQRYTLENDCQATVRQAGEEAVRRELRRVDTYLEGKDFIQGTRPSALDAYLHAMSRWGNSLVDMAKDHPNLWRHQKTMARDPAVRFGTAVERGEPPPEPHALVGHVELASITL